ncbi:peroxide stress protein YaaA [Phascolarctobacterium sp.]|uniref:peroxide stress protein YaaA n=1 Tax=Phascolarctobacterium sp. TaxID=2049039 RepID=UPI00386594CE
MKIIISPAKQMQIDTETAYGALPRFLDRTKVLLEILQSMSLPELQKLWGCNDTLAKQNYERITNMQLEKNLTPAVLAYVGLQYTHMGPRVLDEAAWRYLCNNLRILSGFYGILRADDGVTPYRLEMQTRFTTEKFKTLYNYWERSIYYALIEDDNTILNLASKEYSKAIERYVEPRVRMVTCVFGCATEDGQYKVKATEAKMARGSMVRWCAEHNVQHPEEVQAFADYGYSFQPQLSTTTEYVFIKA